MWAKTAGGGLEYAEFFIVGPFTLLNENNNNKHQQKTTNSTKNNKNGDVFNVFFSLVDVLSFGRFVCLGVSGFSHICTSENSYATGRLT
jgi:hypothetical protein